MFGAFIPYKGENITLICYPLNLGPTFCFAMTRQMAGVEYNHDIDWFHFRSGSLQDSRRKTKAAERSNLLYTMYLQKKKYTCKFCASFANVFFASFTIFIGVFFSLSNPLGTLGPIWNQVGYAVLLLVSMTACSHA